MFSRQKRINCIFNFIFIYWPNLQIYEKLRSLMINKRYGKVSLQYTKNWDINLKFSYENHKKTLTIRMIGFMVVQIHNLWQDISFIVSGNQWYNIIPFFLVLLFKAKICQTNSNLIKSFILSKYIIKKTFWFIYDCPSYK